MANRLKVVEMVLQDITFALRVFARQPVFFATTVLTIALGVGLSATVFTVVDGVLFRPLPRDPSRLVALYGAVRDEDQWTMPVSVPDLVDWRASSRSFERIEGYDLGRPSGICAAELCERYLKPFVYEVPPNDPSTLLSLGITFLLIAATAAYLRARRAGRVDAMIALRSE